MIVGIDFPGAQAAARMVADAGADYLALGGVGHDEALSVLDGWAGSMRLLVVHAKDEAVAAKVARMGGGIIRVDTNAQGVGMLARALAFWSRLTREEGDA